MLIYLFSLIPFLYAYYLSHTPKPPSHSPTPIILPEIAMTSSPFPPCPPIPKASGPINLILPPTEDRPHRYFVLPNGMEVIVVSDVNADKAAASMDVGVGHLSDPDDLPGCAHFCEHLLFMGTKKFPAENEYQQFLSSHSGHSNAYTAMASTVYFFDVAADALQGALDRFSGFFYEPLFNADCTEREIKAVDSEHKKNIQSDMWRFFQVEKYTSRHDHPYSKFGTGNYESLWSKPKEAGRDPRQQLMDWWAKYYCARRMKLAVVGKEDLETLEKWVRERFEPVPVRSEGAEEVGPEGVRIAFEESPIGPDQQTGVTFTKPVTDTRGLEISFPFPDLDHLWQTRPGDYIAHFVGHEGRGSLLSYLKRKGWSNYLRAGLVRGAAGFDFVKITVDLTPEGLENWSQVGLAIFKYVALLRTQPPSSATFNEIKALSDLRYRFAEKVRAGSYATAISNYMQHPLPRERIMAASLLEKFDADELAMALKLLDPRRATMGVTCKELPKGVEGSWNENEPIYGTEIFRMKMSDAFLKEALSGAPIPELSLPGANAFIPERFDVEKFDVKEPSKRPELLRDTQISRIWHKRDDQFWLPKSFVNFFIRSPIINSTPRNAVLARLYVDLFSDSITEDVYDADLAELSFGVNYSEDGIAIGSGGFSDKLVVLLETMLGKLKTFEVNEGRFNDLADELKMSWKNFKLSDPYRQAGWYNGYVMSQKAWTPQEKLAELEHVTAQDVQAFGREILGRIFIETLIHGDHPAGAATEIQDMIERVFASRPLTLAERAGSRSLLLPPASEHVWSFDVPNPAEVNSGIIYYLAIGEPSDRKLRASLQMFNQLVHEPTFNVLRTQEQLGYIVDSSEKISTGSLGFRVLVQSEKDPVYVETRIESFLDGMKVFLEELSDEEFEKNRGSLILKREEKPKNLGEETRRYWGAISDQTYEFGKRETDVAYLKNVTKADVLELLMTHIHTSSPTRSKLSTHMRSQYKGIKFDPTSAQPLIEAFTKHGIEVDQAAIGKLMSSQPDLQAVKDFAKAALSKAGGLREDARKEVESVIAELKGIEAGAGSGDVKLRESNVFIEDIHAFKAGLTSSKAAVPLEPLKMSAKL